MGVSYEQSFVPLLEKQVTAGSGENSAVWNAAVPGYNTTQEAIQLDQMAPLTHPNLIIVQFCMNDYLDAPVLNHQGWLETLPGQPPGAAPSSFSIVGLLYSSRALAFLKEQLRDLQQTHPEWFPVGLHYIHYVHKKPGWERAKAALLQISESARQMHAGLLVVIFPVEQQVRIGDRAAQDDLVRFAVAHSIPVLDLYDSVRAHWREGLYINYWKRAGVVDKLHLNPRGHALVAAEIAHAILSRPDFYFPALPASPMRDASAQAAAEKLAAR
jgi:lysophospholipase L1-like esterase